MTTETINRTVVVDVSSTPQDEQRQVVAGYTLERRLGTGGYGDVWLATGPGGLQKAVKILHGQSTGPVADSELKSLQLMRELRHPFLLNIERIETVDNRLIIVTELAEGSLEDRFKLVQEQGHKGIPRDELLKYLQDAADALDFMNETHGLQHLDIKPGNLLLQGGHVKVADFGLIKDIRQTNVSMIGGFTPLYAPPELFEGRPGRTSDQYSMAILYQHLLTGSPPFSGRTAAQLTAQHLSSQPNVSVLSPSDRSAVSRALSKNPNARFANCREFVDRLAKQRFVKQQSSSRANHQASRDADPSDETTPVVTTTQRVIDKQESTPLPPVGINEAAPSYRPALFIGIGGLGGEVLCRLQQRFVERFGPNNEHTALPLLYLDTCMNAISKVAAEGEDNRLSGSQTVAFPLRDVKHYHSNSSRVREWLSRRWLYNIPRTQQVEGLRPLGRLALVDHQEMIRKRLHAALKAAVSDETIKQTSERLKVKFEDGPPDVYLVASINGGTGSGTILDAGYLVRDILNSSGFRSSSVTGVLLHATSHHGQSAAFQNANAVACLRELGYFSNPQLGYPGDAACRLPGCNEAPFNETYLVQLGEGLNETEFADECGNVAEYLFCNAVTPARTFFNKCRTLPQQLQGESVDSTLLRTFGVARLNESVNHAARLEADGVCVALAQQWLGRTNHRSGNRRGKSATFARLTEALLAQMQLDTNNLSKKAVAISRGSIGKQVDAYFRSKLESLIGPNDVPACTVESLLADIDEDFAAEASDAMPNGHPQNVLQVVEEQLSIVAKRAVPVILNHILTSVDSSESRIADACQALSEFAQGLVPGSAVLTELFEQTESDQRRLIYQVSQAGEGAGEATSGESQPLITSCSDYRALYLRYALLRFCGAVFHCLIQHVSEVSAAIQQKSAMLAGLQSQLTEMEVRFLAATQEGHDPGATESHANVRNTIARHLPASSTIQEFDERMRRDESIQLVDLANDERVRGRFSSILNNAAVAFLAEKNELQNKYDRPGAQEKSSGLEDRAAPKLAGFGGGHRVLAMLPKYVTTAECKEKLTAKLGDCVSVIENDRHEPFVCCEVAGIELEPILTAMTFEDGRVAEMASRIHTRMDINW